MWLFDPLKACGIIIANQWISACSLPSLSVLWKPWTEICCSIPAQGAALPPPSPLQNRNLWTVTSFVSCYKTLQQQEASYFKHAAKKRPKLLSGAKTMHTIKTLFQEYWKLQFPGSFGCADPTHVIECQTKKATQNYFDLTVKCGLAEEQALCSTINNVLILILCDAASVFPYLFWLPLLTLLSSFILIDSFVFKFIYPFLSVHSFIVYLFCSCCISFPLSLSVPLPPCLICCPLLLKCQHWTVCIWERLFVYVRADGVG